MRDRGNLISAMVWPGRGKPFGRLANALAAPALQRDLGCIDRNVEHGHQGLPPDGRRVREAYAITQSTATIATRGIQGRESTLSGTGCTTWVVVVSIGRTLRGGR